MTRAILLACVPWLLWLLASFLVVFLLLRASRAKWEFRRLFHLHADQQGSAQTLSFVLTLPLFIMVLLFIVQVSQLMIAQVVVEYAAFAGARAAAVWIPAYVSNGVETSNCVDGYYVDLDADNQEPSLFGPTDGGMNYRLVESGAKYEKIRSAAVLACMSICPSRPFGLSLSSDAATTCDSLAVAYAAMASRSAASDAAIVARLRNKLAYAVANTAVEVRFYHKNAEPPLIPWGETETSEFQLDRELGWQDQITCTVKHDLALLPGPGRLLARNGIAGIGGSRGGDGNVYTDKYTYPLTASATIGNEGEKSVVSYAH